MNTPPTSLKGKAMIISAAALVALVAIAFAAAIAWGGPAPIVPLASINEPFAKVDFSAVQAMAQASAA
jgi:hypothetical protein